MFYTRGPGVISWIPGSFGQAERRSIKTRSVIYPEELATRALTKNVVLEYIEIYYNQKRFYSTTGYESPETFEVKVVA